MKQHLIIIQLAETSGKITCKINTCVETEEPTGLLQPLIDPSKTAEEHSLKQANIERRKYLQVDSIEDEKRYFGEITGSWRRL